jgi:hypothetical protein
MSRTVHRSIKLLYMTHGLIDLTIGKMFLQNDATWQQLLKRIPYFVIPENAPTADEYMVMSTPTDEGYLDMSAPRRLPDSGKFKDASSSPRATSLQGRVWKIPC